MHCPYCGRRYGLISQIRDYGWANFTRGVIWRAGVVVTALAMVVFPS